MPLWTETEQRWEKEREAKHQKHMRRQVKGKQHKEDTPVKLMGGYINDGVIWRIKENSQFG